MRPAPAPAARPPRQARAVRRAGVALAAGLAAALLVTGPAAAQQCQTVRFARGAYAHVEAGYATSYAAQCYYLAVRRGQQARVRILYGPVAFSTSHTQGSFQDVQFYTQSGDLFVHVHTGLAGQHPYTIQFEFY